MWGKPEQAVYGIKERRAATSSCMKAKEQQFGWLLLLAYVTRVGGGVPNSNTLHVDSKIIIPVGKVVAVVEIYYKT